MSVDGDWKTTINSPMGVQEGTLTIKSEGETFTGQMGGRMGAQEIAGKVAGDTLTWTARITQPFAITLDFDVTVKGDSMEGSVKAGGFGASPLIGVRA
jgi:hypothetical protein